MILNSFDISKESNTIKASNVANAETIINAFNNDEESISSIKFDKSQKSLQKYLKTLKGSKASFSGYINYANKASTATKNIGIASKASSIILGTLKVALKGLIVGAVITLATKFIGKLLDMKNNSENVAEAAMNAKEKIDNLKESFKSTSSTVKELSLRYSELSQGVNNGLNLTLSNEDYQEFLDISNQLADSFPSLVKGYDSSNNALLNLKGNINDVTKSLDALIKNEMKLTNIKIAEELPSIFEKSKNEIDEYTNKIINVQNQIEDINSLLNGTLISNKDNFINSNDGTSFMDFFVKDAKNFEPESLKKQLEDVLKFIDNAHADYKYNFDENTGETLGYTFSIRINTDELDKFDMLLEDGENPLFKKLEMYKNDLQNKVNVYQSEINNSMSILYQYMYNFLQTDWDYNMMSSPVQTIVQSMIKKINWNSLNVNSWEEAKEYIRVNILSLFNEGGLSSEIQDKLSKLFTIDDVTLMSNDAYIKLYNNIYAEIQKYFADNNISLPLNIDFIVQDNIDAQKRLQESISMDKVGNIDDYNYLKEYTSKFTKNQIDIWLSSTMNINDAINMVKSYEAEIERLNNIQITDFFSSDNTEAISEYQNKISELASYLEKARSEIGLSSEDMINLSIQYGISADANTNYVESLQNMIDVIYNTTPVIELFKEAIASCTDEALKQNYEGFLQFLNQLKNEAKDTSVGFETLSEAISTLQSHAQTLRDIKESMDTIGYIDTSKIDDIISAYPYLSEKVAEYNQGLITSQELFSELEKAYQEDVENYALANAEKLKHNEDFYNKVIEKLPKWVIELSNKYSIDLANYLTYNQAKLAIDQQFYSKRMSLEESLQKQNEAKKKLDQAYIDHDEGAILNYLDELEYYEYLANNALQAKVDLDKIQDELNGIFIDFFSTPTTSYQNFGVDKKEAQSTANNAKEGSSTDIDWAEQALKILQDEVDKLNTKLSNAKGLEEQLKTLDELNDALIKLREGYKKAADEYKDRYLAAVSGLTPDIKDKIESGSSFDLTKYESKTAENINKAIDAYNQMVDAEKQLIDLDEQIENNAGLERSKYIQQQYERELEVITEKLNDIALSTKERNKLLDEQLAKQKLINKELINQAILNKDYEAVSKIKQQEQNQEIDTNIQKIQTKKDENQSYIDYLQARLEDNTITLKEKEKINQKLSKALEKDKNYDFQIKIQESPKLGSLVKGIASKGLKFSDDFLLNNLEEIVVGLNDKELLKIYQEYINEINNRAVSDYEIKKEGINNKIAKNNNMISDIDNSLDFNDARYGKNIEIHYLDKIAILEENRKLYDTQLTQAKEMIKYAEEGTDAWIYWNNEIQELEDSIYDNNVQIRESYSNILKLPLNDIEDRLQEIDNSLSDINDLLDNQTTYISAANSILDNSIKAQQELKDATQEQIDALEEENDLRESNLAVQQAEYDLEKLKNQKKNKIFQEGKGFVYMSDKDEINSAQQALDEAKYNQKITILQQQIKVYDKEIERLNDIKELWNEIATDAQNAIDINKALVFDSDFTSKVLSGEANMLKSINDSYSDLLSKKSLLEDEQDNYTKLQNVLNETAQLYELNGISYKEARDKIMNSIRLYFPEIAEKYKNEIDQLEDVVEKQLEKAGITKETKEEEKTDIQLANEEISKSYEEMSTVVLEVYNILDEAMNKFSNSSSIISDSIVENLKKAKKALSELSVININANKSTMDIPIVLGAKIATSGGLTFAGESHTGMELGYVSSNMDKGCSKKDRFRALCLDKLKPNEMLRKLEIGESVLTIGQRDNIMKNFNTALSLPNMKYKPIPSNHSVSFTGDIIVNGVQDSNSFAQDISKNLPQQMIQELFK